MIIHFIHKLFDFVLNFSAYTYLIGNRNVIIYLLLFAFSVFASTDYIGYLYSLKKSSKAMKAIREQYNILQQILLIHMYRNVYKKVDRFWFEISYIIYLVNLGLFLLVVLLLLLSLLFSCLNIIAGIVYVIHFGLMIAIIIIFFLQTKVSRSGGVEQRCAKKYDKKNW